MVFSLAIPFCSGVSVVRNRHLIDWGTEIVTMNAQGHIPWRGWIANQSLCIGKRTVWRERETNFLELLYTWGVFAIVASIILVNTPLRPVLTHFFLDGLLYKGHQIVVAQSLSYVQLFATPLDCSMPGFPVLHYLLEFVQCSISCLLSR